MSKSRISLTLAVVVLAAVAASAQVEPAPYVVIHQDTIDPAHVKAWEQNAKDWAEAFGAAGLGADMGWRAYRSGFTYAWVSDMPDFAYLDGQEERNKKLAEMLGEGKLEELDAAGAPAVLEHYNEIWKYDAEMTYMPEGFDLAEMKAISVATHTVKATMGKEYREMVKDVIAALEKIDAPVNWFGYSKPFGAGSYAYVSWAKDRASLHSGPDMGELLTQALGAEKSAEIFGRYVNCIAAEEDRDWSVRRDLAYLGPPPMENEEEEGGDG